MEKRRKEKNAITELLLSGKHPKYLDKVVINNEQAPFLQVSMAVR